MQYATIEANFSAWAADIEDSYSQEGLVHRDCELAIAALVGVYAVSHEAQIGPNVYDFINKVEADEHVQGPLLKALTADSVSLADRYISKDTVHQLPKYEGSGVYAHYAAALQHGRPTKCTDISSSQLVLVDLVGHASYDHVVGLRPLRVMPDFLSTFTDYPRSLEIIESSIKE